MYEPSTAVLLALLVVAGAATANAALPVIVGFGVSPAQLGIGLGSLAVIVGGVLGGVKLAAVAREIGHRLLVRHPARVIITFLG